MNKERASTHIRQYTYVDREMILISKQLEVHKTIRTCSRYAPVCSGMAWLQTPPTSITIDAKTLKPIPPPAAAAAAAWWRRRYSCFTQANVAAELDQVAAAAAPRRRPPVQLRWCTSKTMPLGK